MIDEQIEILRRIADRGKKDCEDAMERNLPLYTSPDIWVHLLDEIERLKIEINQTNTNHKQPELDGNSNR